MTDDPLDALLVDGDEFDRQRLADALADLIAIDRSTGEIKFKPAYSELTARVKLLTFLLARKAGRLQGLIEEEGISPKPASEQSGVPYGTAKPRLSELHEEHLVEKDEGAQYRISAPNISDAINAIEEERSDG